MMSNEWNKMGCGSSASEFDCMKDHYSGGNRATGNQSFANHWRDWINPATVQSAHDVGLNTIRIPTGYWSYSAIVDTASEPFADPAPMLQYLDGVVQKAADLGMPEQQTSRLLQQLQLRPRREVALMDDQRINTNSAYSSVGMIEVLNEPVSDHDANGRYPAPGEVPGLIQSYYSAALQAVRDAEASLNVADNKRLHVQSMSKKWGSGVPRATSAIQNDPMTAYDDHNYIGFALSGSSDKSALMHSACTDSRVVSGQDFALTGKWSVTSGVDQNDADWFKMWFTAQQLTYEKPGMDGWVFWTWKTELNDPRWTYVYATYVGLMPTDAAGLEKNVYRDVCAGYR
ncbi:hypothetical protein BST61_g9186 [Cercospora zeina]